MPKKKFTLSRIRKKRAHYGIKRKQKKKRRRAGLHKHRLTMKFYAISHGTYYSKSLKKSLPARPIFPVNIRFLASCSNLFSKCIIQTHHNGHLYVPKTFSLLDKYQESFDFLRRLFYVLYNGQTKKILIDYNHCERIDVDASICMDIILAEFITYLNHCHIRGYDQLLPKTIAPINFRKDNIMKVLFSIGAYRNLRGLKINYGDIEALPVLVNSQLDPERWQKSELHTTQIVEYIKRCLKRTKRDLTPEAESEFYKVIGEIMSNAEEHGTMPHRYAIGFFQETHSTDQHYGIFNFSIFNFGSTIYDTFKSPSCQNKSVINQMSKLSEDYTQKGWLTKADFEEETLWTLYSLQEGVTSKDKKRGNGSIHYIKNFFSLKGDMQKDNISKMLLISGNTRILFDGTYTITEKQGRKRKFKMMTFNDSGEITDKPDNKYVTFAPHFFPGTLITARILIKFDNTNIQHNGN